MFQKNINLKQMKINYLKTVVALFFFINGTAQTATKQNTAKEIYEKNCVKCHGYDGSKKRWGAKDLKKSKLGDTEINMIISNGRKIMPAWKNTLSEHEIKLVSVYIKTLRN